MKRSRRYQQTTTFINPAFRPTAPEVPPLGVQPGARPYLHTNEAGAVLPLFQSVIWGAFAGLLALVIAVATQQSFREVLLWTFGAFLVVSFLAWMAYQRHWFSLSSLERLFNSDFDGDGYIGQETPQVTIKLQDTAEGAFHETKFNLPATEEQLRTLAFGVLAGVPFAEGHWTGRNQAFSTGQFRALRAELIKRGLLLPVNANAPAQGYQFNVAGLAILRYYCPVAEMKGKQ